MAAATSHARKAGEFLSDSALVETGGFREPGLKRRPERKLVEPVVFEVGASGSGLLIVVPAGYVTDGYSMPGALLQLFQPRHANFLLPAILHDWLYDIGTVPRDMCDRILLQAMRAVGVAKWQRALVYWAVRLGGAGGFNAPLPVNLETVWAARDMGVSDAVLAFLKEPKS